MSRSRTDRHAAGAARLAPALALCMLAAGCSDLYFDRRESIVPSAGDAIASNRVTHMVDPWPPSSAQRDIAYNGEKMQTAVERYRQGKIIPPVNATTSSVAYQQAAQQAGASQSATQSASSVNTGAAQSAPSGFGNP